MRSRGGLHPTGMVSVREEGETLETRVSTTDRERPGEDTVRRGRMQAEEQPPETNPAATSILNSIPGHISVQTSSPWRLAVAALADQ